MIPHDFIHDDPNFRMKQTLVFDVLNFSVL